MDLSRHGAGLGCTYRLCCLMVRRSAGSPAWYLGMVPPARPHLYLEEKHHVFI